MNLPALLFGGLLLLGGGQSIWKSVQTKRELALLERTPTSRIGALAEGPAEVEGRAVGVRNARAAWSGKGAAFVRYRIEEWRQSGRHGTWVTLKDWYEPGRFLVDDGSGLVLVQGEVADVDVPESYLHDSKMGRDPPPEVLATLEAQHIPFEGFLGINKRMRFHETAIEKHAQVFVAGQALAANEAKEFGAKFALTVGPEAPLLVTTKSADEETRALAKKRRNALALGVALVAVGAILAFVGAAGTVASR